ncbi:MAG: hypothetical protein JWO83_1057 [Caulobacteraceae bacterium]|nr:hypothetical protein [Caulobacteraceae bacterium]
MVSTLRRHYPAVAKDLLSPLLKLCHLVNQTFGGDFEQYWILAVIGARSLEDPRVAKANMDDLESGSIAELPGLGTNLRSIAASTGIPPETVRRKVGLLRKRGWVSRRGNNLFYTTEGFVAMALVRNAMLMLAASNHRIVRSISGGPSEIQGG